MADLTPEQIQQLQFWRATSRIGSSLCTATTIALDLLAQVDHEPEPASRDEIVDMFEAEFADDPIYAVVEHLLSRYTITRKPQEIADVV